MSVTTTIEIRGIAERTASKTVQRSNENLIELEFAVADAVTDQQRALAVDVSQVKSLLIVSDKNVLMEWNDASGTQGSLALIANEPVVWWDTALWSNPLLATDLTTTFWTNASGSEAAINIQILQDASP